MGAALLLAHHPYGPLYSGGPLCFVPLRKSVVVIRSNSDKKTKNWTANQNRT